MTDDRDEPETGPESDPEPEPESDPPVPTIDPELAVLRTRLAALEREYRSAFDQAQREADALFAQYQLSQLVASGGSPAELGRAVVVELVRLAGADGGAIWLGETVQPGLALIARTGEFATPPPDDLVDLAAARRLAADRPDLRLIVLGEDQPASVVGLAVPADGPLDDDGLRVAQLARHELAAAFAGARLREALEREGTSWGRSSTARQTSSSRSTRPDESFG